MRDYKEYCKILLMIATIIPLVWKLSSKLIKLLNEL